MSDTTTQIFFVLLFVELAWVLRVTTIIGRRIEKSEVEARIVGVICSFAGVLWFVAAAFAALSLMIGLVPGAREIAASLYVYAKVSACAVAAFLVISSLTSRRQTVR